MSQLAKPKPTERNYEVGRGKPPKKGQFPKGVSGNPGGPKVGSRRSRTFDDILNERLNVKMKAKPVKMTRREVGYRQIGAKIEQGDHRAIQIMIEHDRRKDAGEASPDPFTFDPDLRREMLREYEKEIAARQGRHRPRPPKGKSENGR